MIQSPPHISNKYFVVLSAVFLSCVAIAALTSFYWIAAIPFIFLFFSSGWQQWQIVFFILLASLPWSVEYNFNPQLGTDLPDEPIMLLVAGLFLPYFFYKPRENLSSWKHPLMIILFFHLDWILITLLFSTDWVISLKYLVAKCWYVAAFVFAPLLIFKSKRAIQSAALVFLISMTALTLFVIYRHYNSGFTFAKINDALQPFFRNHVNYSAMLVCTIPVLISCYVLNKKFRLLILAVTAIVLFALFFSYSRGAWLALIAGVVAYWLIAKRKLLVAFIAATLIVVAAVFWLKSNDRYLEYAHNYRTTIFHKNFQEHLVATYRLKDVSTAERFNRWIAGVRMIRDKWATGYGPNTFYYNYKPYTIPAFKTWVSKNEDRSTVHNYFLLMVIEQGIPGLLIFLFLVGSMLNYSEYLYARTQDKFYKMAAMCCGVMLTMIIVVNFLSDLIETDKIGSLFFLCLAALVAIDKNTKQINVKR